VWSLDVDPAETRLATGCTDAELRIYRINPGGEDGGGKGGAAPTPARGGEPGQAAAAAEQQQAGGGGPSQAQAVAGTSFLVPMGTVRRQSGERVETLRYAAVPGPRGGVLLTCQAAGRVTEVYRVRPEAEAVKRMKRRRRRRREKAEKRAAAAAAGDAQEEEAAAEVRRRLLPSLVCCLVACMPSLPAPCCLTHCALQQLWAPPHPLSPLVFPPRRRRTRA
jgi:U3 small nucleolar RNA-associated protein 12